tara:strand:+ start:923 stop:2545 length:1623 start_codon:yes stop_codon:yes gene_type:complete
MKKIAFIADVFAEDVLGGGELNNKVLIDMLTEHGYTVEKFHSHNVTNDILQKHHFFIVSNFINLKRNILEDIQTKKYVIYEHDHKYIKSRNPATYGSNLKAPPSEIINYKFYKNAIAVLCQSKLHKQIVEKNLQIDNVVNLGGNLWSSETLNMLENLSKNKKQVCCSIMKSNIPHKNTAGAIDYCNKNNLEHKLCHSNSYHEFLAQLSENSHFVFFPLTPETLSRVVVEARMLGCSVITTKIVGATSEEWFKLKGPELINFLRNKKNEIVGIIEQLYNSDFVKPNKPIVSIITTFCDGKDYLEHFMKNITSQSMFDKCELLIIDADSNNNEKEIIEKYTKQYNNIIYHRIDEKLKPTPCINMAIQMATGNYLSFAFIDDVKADNCIETLFNEINSSPDIDLVYGDVIVVDKTNQFFSSYQESDNLFEHSQYEFSNENMVKCVPGPMPMWRSSMHEKNGFFDTVNCNYADDWEMWLRSVASGSKFKKINQKVGLYYVDGRSQQNDINQRIEEAKIFFTYSHLFGNNYNKFAPYFSKFLEKQ